MDLKFFLFLKSFVPRDAALPPIFGLLDCWASWVIPSAPAPAYAGPLFDRRTSHAPLATGCPSACGLPVHRVPLTQATPSKCAVSLSSNFLPLDCRA
eukprot:304072-Chlamydomonas_euryale.AAC.3